MPSRLEKCARGSLINFKIVKCTVLHLGRDNSQHEYRLGSERIETGEGLGDTGERKIGHELEIIES